MTDAEQQAYILGGQAAWRMVLSHCLAELRARGEQTAEGWVLERSAAIAALREVCRNHGDNDWPDNLHLVDIIEKHLERHLERTAP